MTPAFRGAIGLCAGLILVPALLSQGAGDVDVARRGLRHGELLVRLEKKLADFGKDAAEKQKQAVATDLARVRLEAQLLQRVVPLEELPGRKPAEVLALAAALQKNAREELVLARLAFLLKDQKTGEASLGRARDADSGLKRETDIILAAARRQRMPRGGYFRYRGVWLALADRDYARALDDALEALAAVETGEIEELATPLKPDPTRPNRASYDRLGKGVGEAVMRQAVKVIAATLGDDYASVRAWLPSYAARPGLRDRLLVKREAMRVVQREAVALIGRCTKLDQQKVDGYRKRLTAMHAEFQREVSKDFAALRRLSAENAWALHERLRRRENAIESVDRFFAIARLPRLAAGVVQPSPGSTVTTTHLLPGRRTSGLEDTLWLLVKYKCEQNLDVFYRSAEILRHHKRLTPWEHLVIEIMIADAIDSYNSRVTVSLDGTEREFVRILNSYRRILGRRPFELEERLDVASKKHSQEMVDLGYFGHMSPVPRNRSPSDRARLEGYHGGVGENCLSGSSAARGAFEGWYHSPGHHRGMIGGGPHLGVGRAAGTMWTMVAGGTDWTWRTLHKDLPPARHRQLTKLVSNYATQLVKARGTPKKKIALEIERLRRTILANLPGALPHVARVAFAAARERHHASHAAFPSLMKILIEAEVPTSWRGLQVAAVAATIEALRFSDRPRTRELAWQLVAPHLLRKFEFDAYASDIRLGEDVADIRKHWQDLAQWRFRAASNAMPPSPRRMAGRRTDGPSLNAARRMITRRERLRMAKKFGGGTKTEQAVERGLAFLASVQDDDGAWRARSFPLNLPKLSGRAGNGNAEWEIAMTGFALLSFSSAGYSAKAGAYAETVAKGARFLAGKLVDYGRFETTSSHYMYNHAIGTQALCEVYAYSTDPLIGAAAQLAVDYLVYAQHAGSGGWRYEANQSGDTSVTGWVIMALNSAFKAELDVAGFRGAERFLDHVTQSPYYQVGYTNPYDAATAGSRLTAVAMTGRLFLGAPRNSARLILPAYRMMEDLPAKNRVDFYYWYYATLALFQLGDPFWKKWNAALMPVLLEGQDVKSTKGLRGSWTAKGRWAGYGGRIYQTSLAILMLTTYYRYDRSPKVRLYPFSGDIEKAIAPMFTAIRDESDNKRQRIAMRKVVDSFGASFVGPAVKVIRDKKADLKYRRRLASLLEEVTERRHAPMLIELMALEDNPIVISVLRAFVRSSSRRSVPALLHNLRHKNRDVRAFSAQNLGRLGNADAVVGINARIKTERDKWVKGELQKALHQLAKRSRVRELLALALPEDVEGYLAIVDGMAPLERDGLIEFIFALQRTDPKLYKSALETIAEHRESAGVPLLLVLMESKSLDARTRATRLLRGITRKNFRFNPKATPQTRRTSLQDWRRWWDRARSGFGSRR
jgi:Cysteine-rich secretory protein family